MCGPRILPFVNLCDVIPAGSRGKLTEFVSFPDRPCTVLAPAMLYRPMAALYAHHAGFMERESEIKSEMSFCVRKRV
jgi:hypothetical protein